MPKVTVILTSFNHDKYISDAIESVLNQTYSDFELIIWDDASSDNSWDVIRTYSDRRVKAFRNDVNLGPVYGVNKSIFEFSDSEYIAIHHSDDVWHPEKLERQISFLDSNEKISAIFSRANVIDDSGAFLNDRSNFYASVFDQPNRSNYEWLRFFFEHGNSLCHPSVLVRRSIYLQVGGYRPELDQLPDLDMWIRICMAGEIHVLEDKLISFRVRDGEANTSGDRPDTRVRGYYEYYKIINNYKKINEYNGFKKIFPEVDRYCNYENFNAQYALAMICLDLKAHKFTALFGLDMLYALLADSKKRQILEDDYHFGLKEYSILKSKHDVFGVEERRAIAALENRLALKSKELDAALSNIAAMRSSTSWRITSPLRLIGYLLRGEFKLVLLLVVNFVSRLLDRLPQSSVGNFRKYSMGLLRVTGILPYSSANLPALEALVDERCRTTNSLSALHPLSSSETQVWPKIDISVVTYNSRLWIDEFVESLLQLNYPKDCLTIRFVDNSSTDDTEVALLAVVPVLEAAGFLVQVLSRPNLGFGAGHNAAIRDGGAEFCLVTNIDLTFEPDSLSRVVSIALADNASAAAWEFRQKPYEHPKYYDPVSGSTNWNSHACVLLRRAAVESIGGYDEALFMYAEDVELSFRLRRAGYLLRYCPSAVVWHYSYESSSQVKPLQYIGSTFGNLYLRLKYGRYSDVAAVPFLGMRLLVSPEAFPGSRRKLLQSLFRLLYVAPRALKDRRKSRFYFPFRGWDYDLIREGAFVELKGLPVKQPLISIITRTYKGRDLYLRQALISSANQTWSNLEHIVVEDGGDTMRNLCEEIALATGRNIRFIANGKFGRSNTGNVGLEAAGGRWCLFLDDDDLLFSDHIEVLANALLTEPDAVASYAPAMEVVTDATGIASGKYVERSYGVPPVLRQVFDYEILMHHNYFAIQSVLFERRLYKERGGFDEDMDALEDWLLWVRYAKGNRFIYVPKVTSMYRTPADPEKAKERAAAFENAYALAVTRAQAQRES